MCFGNSRERIPPGSPSYWYQSQVPEFFQTQKENPQKKSYFFSSPFLSAAIIKKENLLVFLLQNTKQNPFLPLFSTPATKNEFTDQRSPRPHLDESSTSNEGIVDSFPHHQGSNAPKPNKSTRRFPSLRAGIFDVNRRPSSSKFSCVQISSDLHSTIDSASSTRSSLTVDDVDQIQTTPSPQWRRPEPNDSITGRHSSPPRLVSHPSLVPPSLRLASRLHRIWNACVDLTNALQNQSIDPLKSSLIGSHPSDNASEHSHSSDHRHHLQHPHIARDPTLRADNFDSTAPPHRQQQRSFPEISPSLRWGCTWSGSPSFLTLSKYQRLHLIY